MPIEHHEDDEVSGIKKATVGGVGSFPIAAVGDDHDCQPRNDDSTINAPEEEDEENSPLHNTSSLWQLLCSDEFHHKVADVVRLAVPTCTTQLLRTASTTISTIYCGRTLDSRHFGAVATGLTFTTLTALSLGAGIASAMDTLSTQAYGRAKQRAAAAKADVVSLPVEVIGIPIEGEGCEPSSPTSTRLQAELDAIITCQGTYLRQSLTVTYLVYAPIALLYMVCRPAIRLLVAEEMADLVVTFLQLSVFIVVPMIATNNFIRFSQSQREPMVGLYASGLGAALLLPLLLCVRPTSVSSVARCLALNRWLTFAFVVFLTFRQEKLRVSWGEGWVAGFLNGELQTENLKAFFVVGLPSLLANAADTWSFEMMSVLAASVGDVASATWSVLMTTYGVLFSLFVGVASAASITVGNAIGSGSEVEAKMYAKAVLLVTLVLGGALAALLYIEGYRVFELVQTNPDVNASGRSLLHIGSFTFILDVVFYVMQGIYRGIGQQRLCAITVFAGMWGVAVPFACLLTKGFGYGVLGIVAGLTTGLCLSAPLQWYLLFYHIDWRQCLTTAASTSTTTSSLLPPPSQQQALPTSDDIDDDA